MEKMTLGKTGLKMHRLGFGGIPIMRVDDDQAVETVLHCIENGLDYIDTARAYGESERRIGLALKKTDKKVLLASKAQKLNGGEMRSEIETSLKNLGVDYIDLYQCHFVSTLESYETIIGKGGALEALLKAKDEGLIGHVGITTHSLDLCDRIIDDGLFETLLICYGILEPQAEEHVMPKALEAGMGVIIMKALSGGWVENAELGLKFNFRHPGTLVLAGMEDKALFDENWAIYQSGDYDLSEDNWRGIKALQKEFGKQFCHRCDYCQPCPQGVPIQAVLGLPATVKRMGLQSIAPGGFAVATLEKARECEECGECESRCPYELPIPELIKERIQWAEDLLAKNC